MPELVSIPPLFLERMRPLLGDEYAAFSAALQEEPVSGLRVNTLKLPPEEFRLISPVTLGEGVPWCPSAFNITHTPLPEREGQKGQEPGKHPYHLAGLYYLQDPSAMSAAALLDPQPGEHVLDLAAAPGGKTTQMAALMQGKGLLVANEIKDKRLGHLAVNVERWGAGNVVITNETPERLADHFGAYFDRVLVDAPCSGEGMFRKDMSARRDWSTEMVAGCAVRQKNILRLAAKLVRPGGYLLYSTCTFAPEEDEEVVARFLEMFPEYETIQVPLFPGFMPGRPDWTGLFTKNTKGKELKNAVRLFPHRIQGEGHFACLMKRSEEAPGKPSCKLRAQGWPDRMARPSPSQEQFWRGFAGEVLIDNFKAERLWVRGERLYLVPEGLPDLGNLRVPVPGVWLGTFKKERFEPAHPLALFLKPGQARDTLDLSTEEGERRSPLRAYMRGESIPSEGAPGWKLVTMDGWPLGWGKRVQGVLKNHYPRGWQVSYDITHLQTHAEQD
jgi:NOL1/NOP2/sun family putative RNA methylase